MGDVIDQFVSVIQQRAHLNYRNKKATFYYQKEALLINEMGTVLSIKTCTEKEEVRVLIMDQFGDIRFVCFLNLHIRRME